MDDYCWNTGARSPIFPIPFYGSSVSSVVTSNHIYVLFGDAPTQANKGADTKLAAAIQSA